MSTDKEAEALSALMDGEAGEFEVRALLRDSMHSPAMAARWERYHRVRDALHGHEVASTSQRSAELAARVSAAIAQESALAVPSPAVGQPLSAALPTTAAVPLWRRFAQVAVAASVALTVVVGWEFVRTPAATPAHVAQVPAASAVPVQFVSTPHPGWNGSTAAPNAATAELLRQQARMDQRFNHYLISHSGNAARQGGPVPYVRVVTLKPGVAVSP